MATESVRRSRELAAVPRPGRATGSSRHSPEIGKWLGVAAATLVLGLATARVASSPRNGALLLLAALIPFVLMVVRDVRRALLVVVVFDTAFQWDKNFHYQDATAKLGALGGLSVSLTTIALFGLYLMWFAEMAARRTAVPRGVARAALPLVVYTGITALSTVVAGDKTLSEFEVTLLVQTLLLFVYVAGSIRTREDIRFVVVAIIACLFCESLITLMLPYIGSHRIIGISTYADTSGNGTGGGTDTRFGGTIGSPNTAASFFSLLIAPCVALIAAPFSRGVKQLAALAVGLATLALILTLSRGGWIALAVSLTFLTVVGLKRGWISPRIPIFVAIGLTVIVLPFSGRLTARITGSDQGSASSRIPLIHLAENVIEDHPYLGVGANNLGLVFPTYAGPAYDRAWIYTVHNKYLLVWSEAGIGALLAFLWFLGSTLRRGWSLWRRDDPLLSPLALGLTAGIIGQTVHMSVDIFQSRPQIQLLWLVAGLLVAMQNVARET
ncbi:MAG: hypothetical protein E6G60_03910 [Actinobacteria bacterium]|nr:MAG: hypothetical protein E6G60_03910 [Actinomycetota bacterium]